MIQVHRIGIENDGITIIFTGNTNKYTGTLGAHTEMDGVPFIFNPAISVDQTLAFDVRF